MRHLSEPSDPAALAAELDALPDQSTVAVVHPGFVGHRHSLRLALTDPRFDAAAVTGALTTPVAPLRSALTSPGAPGSLDPDRLADALTGTGTPVHRPELGTLVAEVPSGEEERQDARRRVAEVDEEAVRLRSAVKARDGFFTTFLVSPYSRYIARWCARRGLTPNQVTTASLLTALIAAGCAATGERAGFVAAGLLLLASFVLDATDGQLARYALKYSTLGAWLDATFDRAKEYAYFAGLALGAARADGDDVWALALGAMVLQTVRHVVDFAYNEAHAHDDGNSSPTAALSQRLDSVGWTVWARRMVVLPIGERWALIAVLTACTTPRVTLTVLLVGCALAACYTTAGRLLRSVNRKGRPYPPAAARALAELADSGPLATLAARLPRPAALPAPALVLLGGAALVGVSAWTPLGTWWPVAAVVVYALLSGLAVARPLSAPLDWLVPPLLRAAEYGTVLVLAARAQADGVNGSLPAAFGLVAAVAYHHYDTVYRIRGGTGAPPALLVRAIGGHEGRTLVVTLAAACLLGGTGQGFTIALTALAVALALAVLWESIRFWVSSQAPAVHDESGEPA